MIDPAFVELEDLTFTGATANGVSIDDGGSFDTPAHHLVLRRLKIADVGSQGNHDGLKLSGVTDFRVEECTIECWGTRGGSGIDMVGCHHGAIEKTLLRHTDATGVTGANGVQAKGGSSAIVIRRNHFENAGGRSVNIGGSTGAPYFRPPLEEGKEHCEARKSASRGIRSSAAEPPRRSSASMAPSSGSTPFTAPADGRCGSCRRTRRQGSCRRATASSQTTSLPSIRNSGPRAASMSAPATAPRTFTFARNFWFCLDVPARSRPTLPVEETAGSYWGSYWGQGAKCVISYYPSRVAPRLSPKIGGPYRVSWPRLLAAAKRQAA